MRMKEVTGDLNKGRHVLCLWIGSFNTAKMSIFPKLNKRFNSVSYQNPRKVFNRQRQAYYKIHTEKQRPQNGKNNLSKEEESRSHHST